MVVDLADRPRSRLLKCMRKKASKIAARRGHKLSTWRRTHAFRFTATCERCGARVEVTSWTHTAVQAQRALDAGMLVVKDTDPHSTDEDFIVGLGEALATNCRGG